MIYITMVLTMVILSIIIYKKETEVVVSVSGERIMINSMTENIKKQVELILGEQISYEDLPKKLAKAQKEVSSFPTLVDMNMRPFTKPLSTNVVVELPVLDLKKTDPMRITIGDVLEMTKTYMSGETSSGFLPTPLMN